MKDSIDFGSMDIPKLFRKLLIPTVLGMIFSAIFIITDGIFVGKGIGSDALAAVNITAPLFLINTGVALMFGIGASVVASIHLSQGKVKVARINIHAGSGGFLLTAHRLRRSHPLQRGKNCLAAGKLSPSAASRHGIHALVCPLPGLQCPAEFRHVLRTTGRLAQLCHGVQHHTGPAEYRTGLSVYFRFQMGNVRCGLSYQPGIHRRRPDDSDLPDAAAPGTALVQSEIIIQESASHPPQHGLYVQTRIVQFPL